MGAYVAIAEQATKDLRDILAIPANHKTFFMQGGATLQFAGVPLNLLGEQGAEADYIVTGQWSEKAVKECNKYGKGNEELEKKWLKEAEKVKLFTLAGHRSVGGIRASLYNGTPLEGVACLADFMKAFQQENAK